jgi:ribosomal protein L31E
MAQVQPPRFVAELSFRNQTKRTYRFEETTVQQNIQTLYIQQRAFEKQPKRIRVTVEVIE